MHKLFYQCSNNCVVCLDFTLTLGVLFCFLIYIFTYLTIQSILTLECYYSFSLLTVFLILSYRGHDNDDDISLFFSLLSINFSFFLYIYILQSPFSFSFYLFIISFSFVQTSSFPFLCFFLISYVTPIFFVDLMMILLNIPVCDCLV